MRWEDFCRLHPRAHLIVAKVAASDAECPDGESLGLLRRLVVQLQPKGDYALQAEEGNFHLAVETDYDRDRVRSRFSAEADPSPDGWASSAAFSFDPTAMARANGDAARPFPGRRPRWRPAFGN